MFMFYNFIFSKEFFLVLFFSTQFKLASLYLPTHRIDLIKEIRVPPMLVSVVFVPIFFFLDHVKYMLRGWKERVSSFCIGVGLVLSRVLSAILNRVVGQLDIMCSDGKGNCFTTNDYVCTHTHSHTEES